jgi:hypothetical protein
MAHGYIIETTKIALKKILGFVCNVWAIYSLEDYEILVAAFEARFFDDFNPDGQRLLGAVCF